MIRRGVYADVGQRKDEQDARLLLLAGGVVFDNNVSLKSPACPVWFKPPHSCHVTKAHPSEITKCPFSGDADDVFSFKTPPYPRRYKCSLIGGGAVGLSHERKKEKEWNFKPGYIDNRNLEPCIQMEKSFSFSANIRQQSPLVNMPGKCEAGGYRMYRVRFSILMIG